MLCRKFYHSPFTLNTITQGTTSFKLSEVLKANGVRTGLFVSPHLASFRERIQVNSELLPEESFVSYLQTLLGACAEHKIPATEFELTFLMAALHFKQTNCEAVVLEVCVEFGRFTVVIWSNFIFRKQCTQVGCGGEYDATNVFNTALSIICSVCKFLSFLFLVYILIVIGCLFLTHHSSGSHAHSGLHCGSHWSQQSRHL